MKNFKPLPFEWRQQIMAELHDSKFKVWMYLWWRSDKNNSVDCANSQIERECGLGHCAVQQAKKWLKDNGWLVYDREAYKDDNGKWISPVITVQVGQTLKEGLDSIEGDGPDLETSSAPRPGNTVTVKPVVPVDTLLPVDTSESDPSGLPVNTDKEEVEETASSASEMISPQTPQTQDVMEDYKEHAITTYLLPIAGDYQLNGNCREEAEKLYHILEEVRLSETQIGAVIKFHRHSSDPFMAERISTWDGLLKMIQKPGLISQFRNAQRLASQLNPAAYQAAMEHYGSSAFGIAIAKIIEDKKAKKGKKA